MVFGLCCQREGLSKSLYTVQIFILTGAVYYYLQKPAGKTAPDSAVTGESPQPLGETRRPVWGPMDKCYPVSTQRRKVRSGKKQGPEATVPRATGGQSHAAPKEERPSCPRRSRERKGTSRELLSTHLVNRLAQPPATACCPVTETSRDEPIPSLNFLSWGERRKPQARPLDFLNAPPALLVSLGRRALQAPPDSAVHHHCLSHVTGPPELEDACSRAKVSPSKGSPCLCLLESPVAESREEGPAGWGSRLVRKLWPGSADPEMQNHQ